MNNIRNFSIIAHIDHGKSTLADRIIEYCGAVSQREMGVQMTDSMDIEKERGITIKAQSVRLEYIKDGKIYILNLIDTPGHVDFSYEVSKSLASSDGALLVVDATQGVEAQTIANAYVAVEHNLEIIPVLNKIDLPSADPDKVVNEIEEAIGIDCSDIKLISAKSGKGVVDLIEYIIDKIPAPQGDNSAPLKAIIYDSWFDSYLGSVALIRMFDGTLKKGDEVLLMSNKNSFKVLDLFYPNIIKNISTNSISCGEIAILILGVKDTGIITIGDTVTHLKSPTKNMIAGYKPVKSFVFAGIYTIETDKFEELRDALSKLSLNDSSITYEPETSIALGYGFRVGFLGMLHMEVIKERLEREFDLNLIATAPSVTYKVMLTNGEIMQVQNPSELPNISIIDKILEPYVLATVMLPSDYVGAMITLLNKKRGKQVKMDYIGSRVMLVYDLPLNEIISDFYDELKSISKGYASFDYDFNDYREGNLVKLDIKVAGDIVDALSTIVSSDKAESKGRILCKNLKELIPRQLFEVALQASIGSKVIARETVKSVGKNVTAKCYGGDITRKRKLLEKQKEGKKRMKAIGKVNIPQEAFLSVLKSN